MGHRKTRMQHRNAPEITAAAKTQKLQRKSALHFLKFIISKTDWTTQSQSYWPLIKVIERPPSAYLLHFPLQQHALN